MNQVTQLSKMLDALITKEQESDVLEAIFIQALYWSLGGSLIEDSQVKFDGFVKYIASMPTITDEAADAGPGELPGQLDSIYEYFFDQEKKKVLLLFLVTIIINVFLLLETDLN